MAVRRQYGRLTSGFRELDKKLSELKTGLNNTIIRKGQRAQCKILAQAMKNAAPNKVTKRSIGYRVGISRSEGKHVAKAGINVGKKRLPRGGFAKLQRIYGFAGAKIPASIGNPLAALFVIGTGPRYRAKAKSLLGRIKQKATGRGYTGRMQAHTSFVKAATKTAKTAASQALKSTVTIELKKIWDKQ